MKHLGWTWTVVAFALAFAATWAGVAVFRRWTLNRNLLDIPNERSSHSIPTPRGGGLVIVLVTLIAYAILAVLCGLPFSWGYFAGAILVAGVSWLDDLYSIPFWGRLIAHVAAALLLIGDAGFWSDIRLPYFSTIVPMGNFLGPILTVCWIVWLLNAYNFMDGIDGIAALQAVVAGVAWAVLSVMFGLDGSFVLAGIVACSAAGFLIHNWQPASIFMGDVGSAFLGYTLAAMPLLARSEADLDILPFAAIVFVWLFVFDTVLTFTVRAMARKKVWQAHREHIYQRIVISGWSHASVTLLYGAIAVLVCFFLIVAVRFSGIYTLLSVFSLIIPSLLVVYLAVGKKR